MYKLSDNTEINDVPEWYKPLKEIESIVSIKKEKIGQNEGLFKKIKNYQIGLEWNNKENWVDGNAPEETVVFLEHKNSGGNFAKRRDAESMKTARNYPNTKEENQIAILAQLYENSVVPRQIKNHKQEYEYLSSKSSPGMVVDEEEVEKEPEDEDGDEQEDVLLSLIHI